LMNSLLICFAVLIWDSIGRIRPDALSEAFHKSHKALGGEDFAFYLFGQVFVFG
jgi:hypothetical protein